MPEEKQTDDTLSDLKSIEPRKDALIDDPGRRCGSLLMVVFFRLARAILRLIAELRQLLIEGLYRFRLHA